jgi:hypothetical protein
MSLAKFRKVGTKTGSGRLVVSEGIAPAAYLLPAAGLPTWYLDSEDDRFEIVIPKGTILSVVANATTGDAEVVPANGTASSVTYGDNMPTSWDPLDGATPSYSSGATDTVTVPARSVPIGVAQYDLYRPFDKGTSQGAGFITHGYIEYPMVDIINSNLAVGDVVRPDHMGRPVKAAASDFLASSSVYSYLQVGKVIEVEKFATNFDDGLLSYMQLPSDPGALKTVFELTRAGAYSGKLGIRSNLDVHNVIGAFRVNLTI